MTERLVFYGPNGARITRQDRIVGVDVSDIPNSDSRAPIRVAIERECNMGGWHVIADGPMPLYDMEHDQPTSSIPLP